MTLARLAPELRRSYLSIAAAQIARQRDALRDQLIGPATMPARRRAALLAEVVRTGPNRLAVDMDNRGDVVSTFERSFRIPVMRLEVPLGHELGHAWQVYYLRERMNAIVLKGRQVGASTCAAAKALHVAHYQPGSLVVIVSPTQKQSGEIAIRCKAGLRNIERHPLEQDSAMTIRLANGSRIMSLPGTATSVRGYSAQLLIVDEAAYVDEDTWTAARAVVATGGQVLVQSTPAGKAGWFYELWTAGGPAWARYHVRSEEVPTISRDFLESERLAMGDYAFKAEYGAEFLAAGAGLFDGTALRGMVDASSQPYFGGGS